MEAPISNATPWMVVTEAAAYARVEHQDACTALWLTARLRCARMERSSMPSVPGGLPRPAWLEATVALVECP